MNVQLTMSATRTPSVRTQTVATRAAVVTVTQEMERTVLVSVFGVPLVQNRPFLNCLFSIASFAQGFNIKIFYVTVCLLRCNLSLSLRTGNKVSY